MNVIKKNLLPVLLATIWISFSEFLRNEILFKSYWTEHFEKMGLIFPSEPINGAIWGLWSLFFALTIYFLIKKFSFSQTFFLSWFIGFVLMWVVIGNLGVLPYKLLWFAVPLSLPETFFAVLIIKKLS
jgi:hypothetical protein